MAPDDEDPKVKELLGPATEADLARWFSLPSFQQVEEKAAAPPSPTDPEMHAIIERRAKALAAVDPQFVDAIHQRTDEHPRDLINFKPNLDVLVDQEFGLLDHDLVAKAASIADPRVYDLPPDLEDELKECTPQALLRDLHRPELDFEKQFEVVDVSAEQKLDIVAEIAAVMTTSWKLPPLEHPLAETRRALADLRSDRRRPWTDYLPSLRNRRVRE